MSAADTVNGAMTVHETAAGTPVLSFTAEEYDGYLEGEVRRLIGMARAEFVQAYGCGELDDGDPAVDELVGLLRVGQNGHRLAAQGGAGPR